MFSGSYHRDDVTFLLKRVRLTPTAVAEKERLIQSGQRHYSEMISAESLPSPTYLRVFHESLRREKARFAHDVWSLAQHIADNRSGEITLVSLARAGTPVGVLLKRAIERLLKRTARHYSVSLIRDRGIDENALRYILAHHPAKSVVFVDGWTGKGVIARELRRAIRRLDSGHALDAGLYAVADLCGAAVYAATHEDYLIPSSVLGATISGLVSRSILNDQVIAPGDFHGCLVYEEFAAHDLSRWFVDEVYAEIEQCAVSTDVAPRADADRNAMHMRALSENFLAGMQQRFGMRNVNHIKPGLGEATRVLLRRAPDRLLVRDLDADAVAHLLILANEKNVPITVDAALPYVAAALIKELDG